MVVWSPARSSLLHHCHRQYLLRYVLKAAPAQPDSVARMRGRVIHAGLEAAFAARAVGAPGEPGEPRMARYYDVAEQAMRQHRDTPMLSSIEQADAFAQVYAVLRSIPPPHPAAILGVELPFTIEVDGERATGVIDLVLRTGPASAHIREWKTGTVTWEPLADNALPLYGWVAAERWPWAATITIGLYHTRTGREAVQALDLPRAQAARQRLAGDARRDRAARAALSVATVDKLYPSEPGSHCGGCPFRSYCPQFRDTTDLPLRPGVDVVAERHRLAETLEQRS